MILQDTNLEFYSSDPLWDGAGCESTSTECCTFNSPPWFYKQLPQPTTDNIEMMLCRDKDGTVRGMARILPSRVLGFMSSDNLCR